MKPASKGIIGGVLGAVLLTIAVYVLVHKLKDFTLAELLEGLKQVHISHLILAIALTAAYYAVTTLYDALAFRFIKHPLPYKRVALASFVAYAFSHNVGLSILSSGSMRYRIHSSFGLKISDTAKVVVFSGLSVWIGFLLTSGLFFTFAPIELSENLGLPFLTLRPVGIASLLVLSLYIWLATRVNKDSKIWKIQIPKLSWPILTGQLIVGLLDWLTGAAVVYMLIPHGGILAYHQFLEIFLVAQMMGLMSQVPGGIGVFESAMIFLLPESISSPSILASLLLYRGIFYIMPLLIATMLLATHEVTIRSTKICPDAES